jgi:hypothetical protein
MPKEEYIRMVMELHELFCEDENCCCSCETCLDLHF